MITGKQNIFALAVFFLSLAVSAFVLISSARPGQTGFPLDDAWIHLVYGRSVAQNGYLAYNTGIPSTGSTSPLWAYMLGLVHAVLRETDLIILGTKILGAVLHAVMALLAFRLVLTMTSSTWGGFLAGIFLGSSPALASASLSGMEISLGCMLCLAGILCFLKERWGLSGFLLGLAGLARPEFAAVIFVLAVDMLIRITKRQVATGAIIRFFWPIVLLAAIDIGWDLAVDGRPFPATFYAKAIPRGGMDISLRFVTGLGMITGSAPLGNGILVLGLLSLFLIGAAARRFSLLLLCAGVFYLTGNLVLIPPFDPEAFYHIRYLLPSVPLLFTGVVTGLVSGTKALSQTIDKKKERTRIPIKPLLFLAIGFVVVLLIIWTASGLNSWKAKYSRDCRNINEVQVELGQAIGRGLSPDARVGTIDAGAIRYFGARFTVDLMGMNTPDFTGADCQSQALDVLVLMPAWIRLPSQHNLIPVLVRQTDDYRVTSNPRMNRQLIAVCESDSPPRKQELRIQILGKTKTVCLRCLSPAEAGEMKKSLAAK
jgi:hypothetical protein